MPIPVLCTYSRMLFQEHFDVESGLELKVGDRVVLSTRRGVELGRIAAAPGTTRMRREEAIVGKVVRRAAPEDVARNSAERVRVRKTEAFRAARKLVEELEMPMTLVEVEEMLDDTKYVFYFTAEGRIDFRELVRRMSIDLGKRIELRQIGARDVARLVGDVGSCGEELCCKSFLIDFVPVSMKMAKNQGMSLDMGKVSGMCGRLKCCLKYEDDLYSELRQGLPLHGQPVKLGEADGWVAGVDILNRIITVDLGGKREEHPVAALTFDAEMSERDIRTFQRDRRARIDAEREAKRAEAEARRERRMGGARPAADRGATSQRAGEVPPDAAVAGREGEARGAPRRREDAPASGAPRRREGERRGAADRPGGPAAPEARDRGEKPHVERGAPERETSDQRSDDAASAGNTTDVDADEREILTEAEDFSGPVDIDEGGPDGGDAESRGRRRRHRGRRGGRRQDDPEQKRGPAEASGASGPAIDGLSVANEGGINAGGNAASEPGVSEAPPLTEERDQ